MFGERSSIDVTFAQPVTTAVPTVKILEMWGDAPAPRFEIRAYG